ncbi:Protein of unknown function [Pyronema omphalodes CBS 100304]|uniref:Uncharacterized protein n=1 Tax=Pyronema omphalodes (strain CBS 100304) TaxID=1076935 RepID=U4KU78_PYROM|nr:Protein of unknown function [Pyronema omphalodes CBS 100304]
MFQCVCTAVHLGLGYLTLPGYYVFPGSFHGEILYNTHVGNCQQPPVSPNRI